MNSVKTLLLACVLGCGWSASVSAQTFTDNWSFVDMNTGDVIGGTLSGLSNGTNLSATGLTAIVTQSPFADLNGVAFTIDVNPTTNQYSASNGVVTSANIFYRDTSSDELYIGTGRGSVYELARTGGTEAASTFNAVSFSAGAPSAAPEPAIWATMIFGLGLFGGAAHRKSGGSFVRQPRSLAPA